MCKGNCKHIVTPTKRYDALRKELDRRFLLEDLWRKSHEHALLEYKMATTSQDVATRRFSISNVFFDIYS